MANDVADSKLDELMEKGNSPEMRTHYAARIKKVLKLDDARTWFLASLFDASHYRTAARLDSTDALGLLDDYLKSGIDANISPSACFDPEFAASLLEAPADAAVADDDSTDQVLGFPVMTAWLEHGFDNLSGAAWFDDSFYRETYPDIDEAVANAYVHFVSTGRHENRLACASMLKLFNVAIANFGASGSTVVQLLNSIPAGFHREFFDDTTFEQQILLLEPTLYKKSIGVTDELNEQALLVHFLLQGWREGRRLSPLFNETWYREQVSIEDDIQSIDFSNPWLHWYFVGRTAEVVPTPLFDTRHYLEMHDDVRRRFPKHPYEHWLLIAFKEHVRSASVYFEPSLYRTIAAPLSHPSPLVDYCIRGQFENIAHVEGFDASFYTIENPWANTPAEAFAMDAQRKLRRLDSPVFQEVMAELEVLEPQVVRPYGRRKIRMAPQFHPEASLTVEARNVTAALPGHDYDTVVLIPHCRMAGSAKVSGAMINALAQVTDASRVLVVMTDMSVMERADWFPDNVDVFDFHVHTAMAPQERRVRALMDMVRGLRPKRLVNINSNLGWHLTKNYGRQLSEWMHIYFYLFCWDLDYKGNKGGYPIQWFQQTFDYCTGVFTDESSLREELVNRYAPSKALAERIVTLYEPATDRTISYRQSFIERGQNRGKRRVFWCGRFDRQKRLDLLVQIAAALPDVEFYVYGKSVLGDCPDYLADATDNIRLMGHYECIDDVPIASTDCFLYTSAWDGMPSVLIEMASRNIPIVASNVGGVGELIHHDMGWLIDDADNVDAYISALEELLANPTEAVERATRLRDYTLELCTQERYESTIRQVLDRESDKSINDREIYTEKPLQDRVFPNPISDHFDITAVLTAHGEGALAAVSYHNFETACAHAEANGLSVERIVMLDKADKRTQLVFEDVPNTVRLIETEHGDQGAVRNEAAQIGNGEFIAFIDGDDLWSKAWLTDACRYLQKAPKNVIAHPELCLFFSGVASVFFNIDQEDPGYRRDFLRHANYWDAMCMARRATHLEFPYCTRRIREGFAFEDWHWNCETIEGGQIHKLVPDTLHMKRRREASQTTEASGNRSLMPATSMTDFTHLTDAELSSGHEKTGAAAESKDSRAA